MLLNFCFSRKLDLQQALREHDKFLSETSKIAVSDDDLTIEEQHEMLVKIFEVYTNNKYVEGFKMLDKDAHRSMLHAHGRAISQVLADNHSFNE